MVVATAFPPPFQRPNGHTATAGSPSHASQTCDRHCTTIVLAVVIPILALLVLCTLGWFVFGKKYLKERKMKKEVREIEMRKLGDECEGSRRGSLDAAIRDLEAAREPVRVPERATVPPSHF